MTNRPAPRHFSMILGFHLAVAFTLANAACGVAGVLVAGGLRTAWDGLVDLMDLGPATELLQCPNCGRPGESGAGHCWTCWEALVPSPVGDGRGVRRLPEAA